MIKALLKELLTNLAYPLLETSKGTYPTTKNRAKAYGKNEADDHEDKGRLMQFLDKGSCRCILVDCEDFVNV